MHKFRCTVCWYVYDEKAGVPEKNISPGIVWGKVPDDFLCPLCSSPKNMFKPIEEMEEKEEKEETADAVIKDGKELTHLNLSYDEVSAICSSLCKGCEKQRLLPEMEAFSNLAQYYKTRASEEEKINLNDAAQLLDEDILTRYPEANNTAGPLRDRGALRSLVWSEKVSIILKSLIKRFNEEGDTLFKDKDIFVCDICGFIFPGDAAPEICPICKVPHYLLMKVQRS